MPDYLDFKENYRLTYNSDLSNFSIIEVDKEGNVIQEIHLGNKIQQIAIDRLTGLITSLKENQNV